MVTWSVAMVAWAMVAGAASLEQIVAREQAGDDTGALALAESWAAGEPRSPYGHLEAARLGLKLGRNLEIVDSHLRWVYALAPENPRGLYLWGLLEEERGDLEGARGAQRRAIALRSDYLDAHTRLAALAQKGADWAEAERELRVIIVSGDKNAGTRLQLAAVQEKAGKQKDAERTLTDLHRAEPKNPAVTRALADLYARTGRQRQAATLSRTLDAPKRSLRPLSASRR
jgi:tetratricopeptide (TPR) repeat protein